MDFESPDVAKEFPGLYASESMKRSQSRDSDYSDEEKTSRKDLLGKKKEKRESKKDKGYMVFEGESSGDELDEARSPSKSKKGKTSAFKFPGKDKKDKHSKSKDKDVKEKKEEKEKVCKKESKEGRKDSKESDKIKVKKKKESKLLKIKDKKKKSIDQEVKDDKPIFGVPLHVAVERSRSHDGIELPVVVRECIDYIEEHGLACEGIYKISGLKSKVRNLKSQYNRGEKVYLYEHEPHIVASLLKQFLRDLPEPILTAALASKFEEAAGSKNEQKKVATLQKLMNELPNCNRVLLSWIFIHMQHVMALERRNKMNLQNVSIVLSPTMQISHNVLQAFFTHINVLFKGVELKKYVPPIELDSTRLSLELPDSPSAIAEELSRQENILNILHAELNTGLRDQQKEEQLWEIQRIVTQLKRKLRFLRQIQDTSNSRSDEVEVKCKSSETDEVNLSNAIQLPSAPSLPVTNKNNTPQKESENVKKECSLSVCENKVPEAVEMKDSDVVETVKDTENITPENIIPHIQQDLKNVHNNLADKENIPNNTPPQVKKILVCEITTPPDSPVPFPNIPPCAIEDEDDALLLYALIFEDTVMKIQYDELVLLGDELRRKINSEKLEIDRLKMEITEYQQLYKYKRYAFDSTENSSSDSDDSSASDDEEEDLSLILEDLMKKNKNLEAKNKEISHTIQHEREVCLDIKVEMKMLQTEVKYMI